MNSTEWLDELFERLACYYVNAFNKDTLPNEIPPRLFKQEVLKKLLEGKIDENLACQQIMVSYWKTTEMIEASTNRRTKLKEQIKEILK